MQTSSNVESIFARSWELLTRNWIIIVPGLVVGFVIGLLQALLTPHYDLSGDPTAAMARATATIGTTLLLAAVGIVGAIITQTYMTGMAGAAWARGTTTLADGASAFKQEGGHVLMAIIGLILAGIVAAALSLFTLGLSLLAFYYFFIYTMAAAVVGSRPGFAAMGDSARIAMKRVGPTVIIAIVIFVIGIIGAIISTLFRFAPFVGPIIAAMLTQAIYGFVTLIVVGEYLALRDAAIEMPPVTPMQPPIGGPPVV